MIVFTPWRQSYVGSAVVRFVAYCNSSSMFVWDDADGIYASKDGTNTRDAYIKVQYPDAILCDTEEEVEKVMMLL